MDKTGPRRCQRHDTGQFGLGQPGRDPIPLDQTLPLQPCRQQADTMI